MLDMNVIVTGVTGIISGFGSAVAFFMRVEKKIMPVMRGFEYAIEVMKDLPATQQVVTEVQKVVQLDNPDDRLAHFKTAAYCALQVLNVGIEKLTDIQKAAIAQYIKEQVPERFKDRVTLPAVEDTLKLIQDEMVTAQTHSGLRSAMAFMDWLSERVIDESTQKNVEQIPATEAI